MTHVQDVKAAIGQHDPLAATFVIADLRGQPIERQNFISRVHCLAVRYLAAVSDRIAAISSSRVTVAVPRFMTTRPPA